MVVVVKNTHNIDVIFEHRLQLHSIQVDRCCPSKNLVLEFHECFYHGHHCMIISDRVRPPHKSDYFLTERHEVTKAKEARIIAMGYKIFSQYECGFNHFLKENPEVDAALMKLPESEVNVPIVSFYKLLESSVAETGVDFFY